MLQSLDPVTMVVALGFLLWLYILLPAPMAAKRGRGGVIWVLISFVGSPLRAIILLIALGPNPDRSAR